MWDSIEEIGTFKKDGTRIRTLVIQILPTEVAVLSKQTYTKGTSIFLLENTATFTPEDISVVNEMENLSHIGVLKELAINGHIIFKELTDKKVLADIKKCITNNTKINLDTIEI